MLLTDTGTVYTWGQSNLGNGKDHIASNPEIIHYFHIENIHIVNISAGATHCACISSKNQVYTWGVGANGRLGHGNIFDLEYPSAILSIQETIYIAASCGKDFTLLLDEDGFVWGCGSLEHGKLGTRVKGAEQRYETPKEIGNSNAKFSKMVEIHAGVHHSIVLNLEGTIFTFGCDSNGVLGMGENGTLMLNGLPSSIVGITFYVDESVRLRKIDPTKVLEYQK